MSEPAFAPPPTPICGGVTAAFRPLDAASLPAFGCGEADAPGSAGGVDRNSRG
ncbi:MAG: hypothetical protein AAGK77_00215 [Pseudomonadota bacterium]